MRCFESLAFLFITLAWSESTQAQAVINEVLANEPGASTSLEWVELYNPDSVSLDLADWKFVQGADTTIFSSQIILPAKNYLVLARRLATSPPDVNSFEAKWGDGSGIWGDSPKEDFPALEAKMSLTNSSGTVILVAPDSLPQSFTWSKDIGDGVSWEKVNPVAGDDTSNWKICTLPEGSTPGKINSVTPADNDVAIVEFYSELDNPQENLAFYFKINVQNVGLLTSLINSLTIFIDLNFNEIMERGEELSAADIPQLSPGELFMATSAVTLWKGNHRLIALLDPDDKVYNNQKSLDLRVGEFLPEVVINEIMAAPDLTKNQTEWVELYNRRQNSMNLRGWLFGDVNRQSVLTEDILELPASQFLILAEDKNKFQASYPGFTGLAIQPSSWQTLDNDGDQVILKDSLGFLVEKVSYPSQSLKGISYERIDYDEPASDSNNWWRSVDSSGGTPGRQNSVKTAFGSSIEIQIKPNPFSPDDDGFDDQAEIQFKIPLGVELSMKIYDRKGRLVRTLFEDQASVSGKVTWDGRKDDGSKVRNGIYVLLVETKGKAREVKKETIAVIKER